MLVGRDTTQLDEQGVARAAVESVAENLVDGVTSALFWGVAGFTGGVIIATAGESEGGPFLSTIPAAGAAAGAAGLRAVNTLDALWGHKDERYRCFGWFCARFDDLAHYLPARLTLPLLALAALLLGERAAAALRVGWRDHDRHASPNSAWPEAAMAGALGVRLGGPATYAGRRRDHPFIGDMKETPVSAEHVERAVRLMLTGAWLATGLAAAAAAVLAGIARG